MTAGPVVCAASGAACAYYCLFPLYSHRVISICTLMTVAFLPAAALCFFRVLASWPLMGAVNPRTGRLMRLMQSRCAAFAAGLALGMGLGTIAVETVSFGIPVHTVQALSGVALDDPRILSGGRAMTTLSLKMSTGHSGVQVSARGPVTVFFTEENAERLREFGRGTELYAEGSLRGSGAVGNGVAGNGYTFSADSLHITATAPPLERFRTAVRLGLMERFDAAWGGLALALLIGIRDNLDTAVGSWYRDAGCSHILALSGMHLAVLAALVSFVLQRALGLRLAAVSGAVIILAYCYGAGPLPSLNRAALMYLLGVLAVLGMLKREPLTLLSMAFLLQLAMTPPAGLSLSFILSYLALAGILTIGGMLNAVLGGTIPPVFLSPLSASLGAFIATAGVTAWFFGTLRPVGIIAGLILTPLTTVFMVGAMAWLGLDMVLPPFAAALGRPLSALYWLMEKTALTASYVPGINANPFIVIVLSLLIIAAIVSLYCRRLVRGSYLEPFT